MLWSESINVFRKYGETDIATTMFYEKDFHRIPCKNENNVYISMNRFIGSNRTIDNISTIGAFFSDLDTYTVVDENGQTILSTEDAYYEINKKVEDKIIPLPTFVVDSGNGIYCIWRAKTTVFASNKEVYNNIQAKINEALIDLGADIRAMDAARVLRIPGSNNNKNGKSVKTAVIEYNDVSYSIEDMASFFNIEHSAETELDVYFVYQELEKRVGQKIISLAKRRISPNNRIFSKDGKAGKSANQKNTKKKTRMFEKAIKKTKPVFNNLNVRIKKSVAQARVSDLIALINSRVENGQDCIGSRELLLFSIRNAMLQAGFTEVEIISRILEVNKIFPKPLSKNEAQFVTKVGIENGYVYSNNKLIKLLKITPEEQTSMQTICSKAELRIRRATKNKSGILRFDATSNKLTSIIKFILKGKTMSEIASLLKCSRQAIYRLIKRNTELFTKIKESVINEIKMAKEVKMNTTSNISVFDKKKSNNNGIVIDFNRNNNSINFIDIANKAKDKAA